MPTGERRSSAIVNRNRMRMMTYIGVEFAAAPEYGRKKNKEMPMTILATPNFTGVDHCLFPSFVHIVAKIAEKITIKIGLMD